MIRSGMTVHEVEAALGRPASEIGHGWSRATYGHWRDDDDNEITVTFVDEHVSNEATFQPGNLPLSERLQRLFKRICDNPNDHHAAS